MIHKNEILDLLNNGEDKIEDILYEYINANLEEFTCERLEEIAVNMLDIRNKKYKHTIAEARKILERSQINDNS